jgi:hypothetical protein
MEVTDELKIGDPGSSRTSRSVLTFWKNDELLDIITRQAMYE